MFSCLVIWCLFRWFSNRSFRSLCMALRFLLSSKILTFLIKNVSAKNQTVFINTIKDWLFWFKIGNVYLVPSVIEMLGLFLKLLNNYMLGNAPRSDDELLSLSEVVFMHWPEPREHQMLIYGSRDPVKTWTSPSTEPQGMAVCYYFSKLYRQKHKMFLFAICLFLLCVRTPCWQSVARRCKQFL